jgi:hypothetical protein
MHYRQLPTETPITIEHNGQAYEGTYSVEGNGMVTVSYGARQIVTHVGIRPAEPLARMILREIVSGEPE